MPLAHAGRRRRILRRERLPQTGARPLPDAANDGQPLSVAMVAGRRTQLGQLLRQHDCQTANPGQFSPAPRRAGVFFPGTIVSGRLGALEENARRAAGGTVAGLRAMPGTVGPGFGFCRTSGQSFFTLRFRMPALRYRRPRDKGRCYGVCISQQRGQRGCQGSAGCDGTMNQGPMKNKWLLVVDLASFKAYRVETSRFTRSPRLELIEAFDNAEAHSRLGDKVSDLSGRF